MARLLTALTAAVLAHGAAGRRMLLLQGPGQQLARPIAHRVNLRGGSLADEGTSPSWSVTATGASQCVRERRPWRGSTPARRPGPFTLQLAWTVA